MFLVKLLLCLDTKLNGDQKCFKPLKNSRRILIIVEFLIPSDNKSIFISGFIPNNDA